MDVLDEKANGGQTMEVDDIVSVRDRKHSTTVVIACLTFVPFKTKRLRPSTCLTLDMK